MKYIELCILLILACLVSCSTNQGNADRLLVEAENMIETDPDSTLLILDSVFYLEKLNKDQTNRYYLLLTQAKNKASKDISGDTTIFKAKEYYMQKGDNEEISQVLFYCGRVLSSQKDRKGAMSSYVEAESYADKTKNENLKGLIQSSIGYLYYDELLENEALPRFKQAVIHFKNAGNYKNELLSINDIGRCFILKKENDSAFFYFQKGLDMASSLNDSIIESTLRTNIGSFLKNQGDYRKAKKYLSEAITYTKTPIGQARIYSNIAQVYYGENRYDSAIYYMEKSLDILGNTNTNNTLLKLRIYGSLAMIKEKMGNYKDALAHNKQYIEIRKEVYNSNESQSILDIQKKYNYELLRNANNGLLIQKQYMYIVVLVLVLITITTSFFFYRKNKIKEKSLLEAQQKIIGLNAMAASYDEKVNSFRNKLLHHFNILKKSALLEGFLRDDEKEHGQKLLKKFNEIMYNQDTLDWDVLYQTMNELHYEFFDSLRETYPQLDEAEFRICCLLYADFTNAEIGIIMGQSINTVSAKRSSIRRKIGIEGYGNITEYLDIHVPKK